MPIRSLKPFIPSGADFARARQFFLDLGFALVWENSDLAELRLGAASFLLQRYENRELQENLMMMVEVDDLDGWWQHIQEAGVLQSYEGVRVKPPTRYPWGRREIHLIDPAGVCWHFA
jgi:hypothetical protein